MSNANPPCLVKKGFTYLVIINNSLSFNLPHLGRIAVVWRKKSVLPRKISPEVFY